MFYNLIINNHNITELRFISVALEKENLPYLNKKRETTTLVVIFTQEE
jgi:hypothetical protein